MKNIKIQGFFLLISATFYLFANQANLSFADNSALTISQDSRVSSIGTTVSAPSYSLVDFNYFKITNNTGSTISIDTIKLNQSGGSDNDFARAAMYYLNSDGSKGSQIGADQYFSFGAAYFSGLGLSISGGANVTIAISAVVNGTPAQGISLGISVVGPDSVYPNGTPAPTVSGSVAAYARTVDKGQANTTPPGVPTNILVKEVGSEPTLRITWTDPTDNDLSKINIYRSTVSGSRGSLIYGSGRYTGITPNTSYDDKNIIINTTYYYTLQAVDLNNNVSTDSAQYAGTVYQKGLILSLDATSPASRSINASTTDNVLAAIKFFASMTDIEITNLSFGGFGSNAALTKFYLYIDNVLAASSTSPAFFNDGTKLNIPANESKIILVKGDVSSSATNNAKIALSIAAMTARQGDGANATISGLSVKGNEITIVSANAPSPTPSVSPTPSPSPTPNAQVSGITEGALIRANGDFDVYIVKYVGAKKFKRLILSPSVFNNYGHLKWSDIRDVDQSVVDAFTTSELVRAVNDSKVYKLYPAGDTGEKKWVVTADAFLRMGFDWDAIYEINSFDRDSYVSGSNLE